MGGKAEDTGRGAGACSHNRLAEILSSGFTYYFLSPVLEGKGLQSAVGQVGGVFWVQETFLET